MPVEKVISGGQTGVDRAALDTALALGLSCGGWCPRGRWSEDGPIDSRYPLVETPSAEPALRTEWNVRDSDGTLIISTGELTGGTALTRRLAEVSGKPCLVADPAHGGSARATSRWLSEKGIRVLNVAGPRQSRQPGIYEQAARLLRAILAETR